MFRVRKASQVSVRREKAFDLIVIGGGPAGSTLAAFVAMQGHRVLLLDKDRFPRYQIGESLLPATIHGICAMLGVRDEIEQAGFTRKFGGTFRWGADPVPWTFQFGSSPALPDGANYAYQVERSKFDQILLNNARRRGVDVREGHSVVGLCEDNGRIAGVEFIDEQGKKRKAHARFVADASGNQSVTAKRVGTREYSQFFQNVALFCYFRDGKRLPPPDSGNIISAAFPQGWFWYIPLSPTLTSVGAVIAKEHSKLLQGGHERAMTQLIKQCPLIEEYLRDATRVTEGVYGQFRVRKDYSYCNTRFWVPGALLVGDAACFVDPVFSSGVHLATYSALLAARAINTSLRGSLPEADCFEEFERRYRREYSYFYEFLVGFYDFQQDQESYFWRARSILKTKEKANEAFVRLVAGVGGSGEPLYANARAFFEHNRNFQHTFSRDSTGIETGRFIDEVMSAGSRLQNAAAFGGQRASEEPMFPNGLVASANGLEWETHSWT